MKPYSMATPHARIDFRYGSVASRDFPALGWLRAYRAELVKRQQSLSYGQPEGESRLGTALQGYNYQMNANGEITWLGPLGGYTAGGNSVSMTQATLDGETTPSFDIILKQSDGAFTASTCTKG